MFSNYRFDSRGSVPGILARESADDIRAQSASFATIACAPAVGFANRPMGAGAKMARLAFCALGGALGGGPRAGSEETRAGHFPGPSVDQHCAFHDVGRAAARNAGASMAFGISRSKCAYIRDVRRKAGCVVLQPGRGEYCGSRDRAALVLSSVFLFANEINSGARGNSLFRTSK